MLKLDDAAIEAICAKAEQLPSPSLPEVAVIGRSNVGKSSLINAVLGQRGLLRVSQEPGRTREVIFIRLGEKGFLVDLPGYGFAKAPIAVKRSWAKLVEAYLARKTRGAVLLLLDIRRDEPSEGDLRMVEWLRHYGRPFSVVLTKADQLPRGRWRSASGAILKSLDIGRENAPLVVSVKSKEGIDSLRKLITKGLMTI